MAVTILYGVLIGLVGPIGAAKRHTLNYTYFCNWSVWNYTSGYILSANNLGVRVFFADLRVFINSLFTMSATVQHGCLVSCSVQWRHQCGVHLTVPRTFWVVCGPSCVMTSLVVIDLFWFRNSDGSCGGAGGTQHQLAAEHNPRRLANPDDQRPHAARALSVAGRALDRTTKLPLTLLLLLLLQLVAVTQTSRSLHHFPRPLASYQQGRRQQ